MPAAPPELQALQAQKHGHPARAGTAKEALVEAFPGLTTLSKGMRNEMAGHHN